MDNLYLVKVLSGDRHAFRYFIHTYKDMAFSVAFSMLKNELMAEEVVQESFVQAYLSLSNFRKQSKFSTWLYKIVIRTSYKYRQKNQLQDLPLDLIVHDVSLDFNALDSIIASERKLMIQEAMRKIPTNESLALQLYYLDELTMKEIVEVTGWSESNLKILLHRGRKNLLGVLKKILKGTFDGV